uniref:Serine-threonine/tyrosine-protein kinase catalytic domain-containing protein n=1 Tax=Amphimedon queenslandica TaxID=400682 RepID=A0A1X7SRB2_AMPQE
MPYSSTWSFGVVLWEIMTRGKTPYEDVLPENMLNYLTTGHRLPQPKNCPDDLLNTASSTVIKSEIAFETS